MKKTFSHVLGATVFISSFAAFGGSNFNNSYYIPHVYLSGYGGSNLLGNLDVLAPVYLKADRNLYIYGAANYAGAEESDQDNSWSAEFGAGYRQMFNWTGNQRIYGAYLLGSYNYSSYGNDFWVINPGIESLGQRWDYRINGYIPLNNSFSYQDFASNHGDDSHVNAHDNQTDDMLVTYYENIGYGADAEFGGRLFSVYHMPIKGYIDGYYYNVDSNNNSDDPSNIYGVGARITFQPTSYLSIEFKDTYDNDKANLFEVGAKIYFNGLRYGATNTHVDDQDLQVRLFDDIEHNFGTIDSGVSSYTRQGNTDNPSNDPVNPINPIEKHQVFYSADVASGGDGTAENPYSASELDQGTIDTGYATWDDAQFVLASGSESSYAPGSIEMYDGTSMVGKNSNYTALATGSDLPTVYGALTLDGNNIIDSIILLNDTKTAATTGITVAENAENVVIKNSTIGSSATGSFYHTGIITNANSSVVITSSNIYASNDDVANAFSVTAIDSAANNLTIVDTSISASNQNGNVIGVLLEAGSDQANISGSEINAAQNGNANFLSTGLDSAATNLTIDNTNISVSNQNGNVTGVLLEAGSDQANISGSEINVVQNGTTNFLISTGLDSAANNLAIVDTNISASNLNGNVTGVLLEADSGQANISGSEINAIQNGTINKTFFSKGIDSFATNLTIDNTKISASSQNGNVTGVLLEVGSDQANISDSEINVVQNGAVSFLSVGLDSAAINLTIADTSISASNLNYNVTGLLLETGSNQVNIDGSEINAVQNGTANFLSTGLDSAATNLAIVDTNISASVGYGAASGLVLENGSRTTTINASSISAQSTAYTYETMYGIHIIGQGVTLNITGGTEIKALETATTGSYYAQAVGIYGADSETVNIEDAYIEVLSPFWNAQSPEAVTGIDLHNGSSLYVNNKLYIEISGQSPYGSGICLYDSAAYFKTDSSAIDGQYPIYIESNFSKGADGIYADATSTLDFTQAQQDSIAIINGNYSGYGSTGISAVGSTIYGYDPTIFYISGFKYNTSF